LKLEKLPVLIGLANNNHWAVSWKIILNDYNCLKVVSSTMAKPTGEPETNIEKTIENSLER
jgi:hypothetical protein